MCLKLEWRDRMNWKLVGVGALINAAITVLLTVIYLPLSFIGPIAGGFIVSYFSQGYEDYSGVDWKDGAVLGAISGLIGGLILTLLFIWLGTFNITLEAFTGTNTTLMAYAILQVTIIASFILGLIGGIGGVAFKN
mgnify:CR=1 FL=1